MQPSLRLNRRSFLQAALTAAAAAGAGVACSRNGSPWRFFTLDEARTLASMVDQIIPPDQDAGAVWAGVVNYIDRQLCGLYQTLQEFYRYGLAAVDQTGQATYGKVFADLESHQQYELLQWSGRRQSSGRWLEASLVSGVLPVRRGSHHAGLLRDPRHGGNREGVSWKMLNLPYPPIRGRVRSDLPKPRSS
jgi:gluconate 2-dehydrogenase gamma chain